MSGLRQTGLRAVVLGLYALAMLTLGFAHQGAPARAADAFLAAYTLPDGSVPDLCLTGTGAPDDDGHHAAAPCDACRLTAAPGLAVTAPAMTAPLVIVLERRPCLGAASPITPLLYGRAAARGPPATGPLA
jgi:hypothetical protein